MTAGARRPVLRIALAAAIFIVAVGAVAAYLTIQRFSGLCDVDGWERQAFDSAAWKAASADDRFRYVRDILDRAMFVGAADTRLFDALGEPDYMSREAGYATYVVRSFQDGGCAFNAVAMLHFDIDRDGSVAGQKIRFD